MIDAVARCPVLFIDGSAGGRIVMQRFGMPGLRMLAGSVGWFAGLLGRHGAAVGAVFDVHVQ